MASSRLQKIAITGGKGGTGKSTVAILFANKLVKEGKKVILCDCDVECPNDYLLLGQELKKSKKKVFTEFPKIDKRKCNKCGLCAKTCPNNAIFQAPGQYPIIIKKLCAGCGLCWNICPRRAIRPVKEEVGKIYQNKLKTQNSKRETQNLKIKAEKLGNLYLVTGVAKAGIEETGPIVSQTKKFALDLARRIKADAILFDTAAGTHCPVIHALMDVDFAYAVTEPTPMGAYDLGLILDLCRKLEVPIRIILNRADLGNKKLIEKIADKRKIKIEKEIPYSQKLIEAYSKGQLLNFNL